MSITSHTILRCALLLAVPVLMVTAGCTRHAFPIVHPVLRLDRQDEMRYRAQDFFIKARDYDRQNLHLLAEKFYALALENDPESDVLRLLLIEKYITNARFENALALLNVNRPLTSLSKRERRLLIHIYLKTSQARQALNVYQTLDDLSEEEQLTIAYLCESLGMVQQAVQYYSAYYMQNSQSVEIGLKIADLLQRMKEFDDAALVYSRLEAIHGPLVPVLYGKASLQMRLGDTTGAISGYRTILAADSLNRDALQTLASIYIQQAQYDSAIVIYERLSQEYNPQLYQRMLGLLYYYNHQYDQAEKTLLRLLENDLNDYELHFYLGLVYLASQKDHLAEIEFEKSLSLQPAALEVYQHLSYAAIRQKNHDLSLHVARRAVKHLEKSSAAWKLLGYVYNTRKEHAQSIDPLQRAVRIDSTDADAWFELGSALERTGRFDESVKAFYQVLRLRPRDATAANYLGYMWAERSVMLDSAEALIAMAVSIDSLNGAFLDSYAWVKYMKGQLDEALNYIRKAVGVLDTDPVIFSHYGDILCKLGKKDKAIAAFQKSIELGSDEKELLLQKILQCGESETHRTDGSTD